LALSDLTRREILLATEEYDRLGRDAFLDTYGFAPARSYLLLLSGRTYDSKALVGVAHGYLPGQPPLAAAEFSGGAATVGRLLRGLGFEVTSDPLDVTSGPSPGLPISALLDSLARLRSYRSPTGRTALYQPLTLVWAIGRAHRGLDRITPWTETENALGAFLKRHGEHPRPHYPLAALYHAGLWEIDGTRPVPPAHGDAPVRWFADHRPQSGLTAPVYNLVRYSGEARVATVEASWPSTSRKQTRTATRSLPTRAWRTPRSPTIKHSQTTRRT
jgi:5-methylcytosine-specific restriction protein A